MFIDHTAVIVCHEVMYGLPHELREFLRKNSIRSLIFVGHQNRFVADNPVKSSYIERYVDGKLVDKYAIPENNLPEMIAYIRDFLLTVYRTVRYTHGRVDYFIGLGNLNALSGLLLQKFGKVKKSIYYVIDYMPTRFSNSIVNTVYHDIKEFLKTVCDYVKDTKKKTYKKMPLNLPAVFSGKIYFYELFSH